MTDMGALETTFRMIKAETQLLYSSDYPHWDFDLPSTIYDLPFLSETAKRNILGGNAARVFGLELADEAGEGGVTIAHPGSATRGDRRWRGRIRWPCSRRTLAALW